jgi:hypothetical protein
MEPDHHGLIGDRAIIPSACQITGSTSSAMPRKTSAVTSVLLKNIPSEPRDISMDWRNASSALSPITVASTSGGTPMSPEHWALAVSEHEGMLNALQRRDASGLAHILRTHLSRKRDEVVQTGFAEPGSAGP